MKTENKILMQQARETLSGKWGIAIGTTAIYMLINLAFHSIPAIGPIFSIIMGGALALGLAIFSMELSRNKEGARLEMIFDGFKRFGVSLKAYILMIIFIFLWTLLLIVPGIIAAISYSMTFFIISDNPSIDGREALRESKKMMMGNKWKYFCLQLRFIGWAILSVLTLGVGFLWLCPYVQVSNVKFYEDLKKLSEPVKVQ